jgi:DNA-binding NarL/FixJ family response regulator
MPTAVVVDDYPVMRELLREFLKRSGYEVVGEAGSAKELTEGFARWAPDVLVLDVLLPDANAAEITRRLLAERPDTRILVVSGLEGESELAKDCLAAGARGFLPKPFTNAELEAALASVRR